MARQLRAPGRPRVERVRYAYQFRLEEAVIERLHEQSADAGDRPTTYLERVIGLAHGYESRFIASPAHLPIRDRVGQLRHHVETITPGRCGPTVRDVPVRDVALRLDDVLGDRVDLWCREHNVTYGGYLRSVLRLAAGFESEDELRPQHIQPELPVNPVTAEQEVQMARAG